jgi:hypothetical protein
VPVDKATASVAGIRIAAGAGHTSVGLGGGYFAAVPRASTRASGFDEAPTRAVAVVGRSLPIILLALLVQMTKTITAL